MPHSRWIETGDLKNQTQIIPGTENSSRIRVAAQLKPPSGDTSKLENWLVSGYEDAPEVKTQYDSWKRAVEKFPNNPCLGKRNGESEFEFITYKQTAERADKVGTAFVKKLGLKACNKTNYGMFSGNQVDWTVCAIAANNYNLVQVPLYDTLGDEAMRHITKQCKFDLVCVDKCDRVVKFLNRVHKHEDGRKIDHIVCFEKISEEVATLAKECKVSAINIDDLIADVSEIEEHNPPKPDDIFSICYTSGTTGVPKGVVHTHTAWLADISAVMLSIPQLVSDDAWLSYLPAAHVFERAVQAAMLHVGAKIGFYRGDPKLLVADAGVLKPTIFGGVPRVWNKIYGKLQAAEASSFVKGILIRWAMRNKVAQVKKGVFSRTTIQDKIVFKNIQALLGGKVRYGICGAAPIKVEVMNALRAALGVYIFNGYGQTECGCAASLNMFGDSEASIGYPIACCAMKVDSVPEMDYDAKDDAGEICLKGPLLMKEYYKNSEKTSETIDKDGWLHTGDIGRWQPNGTMQIVDRKKNIFKLSQGEYVAPEKVENVYILHSAVAQCFVYGHSERSRLVGVVMPDEETFPAYAGKSFADACNDPAVTKKLLKDLQDLGSKNGLKSFEQVKIIKCHPELMSVDNNLLTPTMKSKRPQITKHFKEIIDKLYEELGE